MQVLHVDLGREMRGGQYQVLQLMGELRTRGIINPLLGPHGERFDPLVVRNAAVDLVHAHDARAHTWCAVWARKPLIVSRRVAFPIKSGMLSQWKYSRPVMFLAVSKYVAGKLLDAGIPASKIEVVYDGVARLPESTRTGPIIALATSDPMKGSDLIRDSGVDVTFTGNLVEALRTARAFLYITREEGLGSAALLAMSAGVPVIASRVGGLPEIVQHEKTGLLVDNTPRAIAEACLRLPEADEWIHAGREMVHNHFLVQHMADGTLAAYRQVLGL